MNLDCQEYKEVKSSSSGELLNQEFYYENNESQSSNSNYDDVVKVEDQRSLANIDFKGIFDDEEDVKLI